MGRESLVGPNERIDDLGRDGLQLIQNPSFFCFGIDAVLLSSFAKVHRDETVMDFCTGNGIIPVLLSAKTKAKKIIGIEIQKPVFELAKKNVLYNNLETRVEMRNEDVRQLERHKEEVVDVITVNPPYITHGGGGNNEADEFTVAKHEVMCTFFDVVKSAERILKPKGRLYLVHRPLRLVEILKTLSENGLEPKTMRLVHPYKEKEPNLVLIEAIKGAGAEIRISKPLIVYENSGEYTDEIKEWYGLEC